MMLMFCETSNWSIIVNKFNLENELLCENPHKESHKESVFFYENCWIYAHYKNMHITRIETISLLNQPKSDCISHFSTNYEPNVVPFD